MSKPTDRAPVTIEGEFKVKSEKRRLTDAALVDRISSFIAGLIGLAGSVAIHRLIMWFAGRH